MKRLFEYIASRRFAVYLLIIITSVIMLSNLLPKPYLMEAEDIFELRAQRPVIYYLSSHFNVQKVTQSPYFAVIAVFLFTSITVCTLKRMKGRLEMEEKGIVLTEGAMPAKYVIDMPGDLPESSGAEIKGAMGRGWSAIEREAEWGRLFYFKKGGAGFWGSVAFHAGMCLILTGVLFSAFTRYNGKMILTQDFDLEPPKVLKGLSKDEIYIFPIRRMALKSFTPVYEGPYAVDYVGNLINQDAEGGEYEEAVRVNEPMMAGQYQFILSRYGFAPRFVLKDMSGKIISDDIINLTVFNPGQEDSFQLSDGRFTANVRFFPEFYIDAEKGMPASRSRIPKNPVFAVSVKEGGKNVGGGFVKMGGTLEFEDHLLEFSELRYWVQIDVTKDSGVPVITLGFFIIISGLMLRLLLNEKEVWVIIKKRAVATGGRARFFPALFEGELKALAQNIEKEVGKQV